MYTAPRFTVAPTSCRGAEMAMSGTPSPSRSPIDAALAPNSAPTSYWNRNPSVPFLILVTPTTCPWDAGRGDGLGVCASTECISTQAQRSTAGPRTNGFVLRLRIRLRNRICKWVSYTAELVSVLYESAPASSSIDRAWRFRWLGPLAVGRVSLRAYAIVGALIEVPGSLGTMCRPVCDNVCNCYWF